jgi:hypothetical protein
MVTGRLSQSNRETERLESQGVDAAVYRRRIGLGLCAQASSNGGLSAGKQGNPVKGRGFDTRDAKIRRIKTPRNTIPIFIP